MVWALRSVFLMIQESDWEPGGRIDPPKPPPFEAFRPSALKLACPFAIVRGGLTPSRGKRAKVA
jgi:hypothetical protein